MALLPKGRKNKLVDITSAKVDKSGSLPKNITVEKLEQTIDQKLEKMEESFVKRALVEQKRAFEATDSEFWIALCFQTREQKDDFLYAFGEKYLDATTGGEELLRWGDKYFDGQIFADLLGIEVLQGPNWDKRAKANRRFQALAAEDLPQDTDLSDVDADADLPDE